MYEEYWKLREKPFQNNLDQRFFFFSPTHSEALMRILYSVNEDRGTALLTGAFGTGKSMVCSRAAHELRGKGYDVAVVNLPSVPADELVRSVIYALGGKPLNYTKADLLHALSEYARSASERDAKLVVFVDDAHSIRDKGTLEELGLLMNVRDEMGDMMKFVITGEPGLIGMIDRVPFIRRAIEIRYHLTPLSEDETREYIPHRLAAAQGANGLFSSESVGEIHRWSKGIPRSINSVCDLALFMGHAKEATTVSPEIVKEAAVSLSSRPVLQVEEWDGKLR